MVEKMAHSISQDVCTRLIKKTDGYFSPVLQATLLAYLSEVEEHLAAFQQRQPQLACNTEAILLSLGTSLLGSLFELCSRSFLGELYYAKEGLHGDTPEARYQDFLQHHLLPRREELLAPTSELGQLVANRVSCSLAAFRELLERFENDLDLLASFLGAAITSIDDWKLNRGDTHNCGRSVAILTVNGNKKLVYKPHSLENDRIFSGLTDWLNNTGRISVPLRHLRVLSRGAYGWQEYVSHRVCANAEAAEHYMYRLGALIFLAYFCFCGDLHHENLIANGDSPILIDTETLFFNRNCLKNYYWESVNAWDRFVQHSVFVSGLLPADFLPGKPFERQIGNGILTGLDTETQSTLVQMIISPGTDEMGFSELRNPQRETVYTNLAYLSACPLHAGDYMDTISDGFRDAYEATLAHREELLELVRSDFFQNGVFRQLFRDTNLYGKYLAASYHPSYLGDHNTRMTVFEKLKGKSGYFSPEHRLLVQSEIRQLLRDDVPYFYTTFSSRNLLSADGVVAEGFYRRSIEEDFLQSIQKLNKLDCITQLLCLRRALCRDRKPSPSFFPVEPAPCSDADQNGQIISLLDWIITLRERCFRIDPENTEFPLYLVNVPGNDRMMLQPEPPVLYSGIGSTLFYYCYCVVRGSCHERFEALLRAVSRPDSPLQTPLLLRGADHSIGVFDGQGSVLYLNLYLYCATKETQYLRAAEQLCKRMIPLAKVICTSWDVIGGHAGLVILCLNAFRVLPDFSGLRSLAETCGEMLYEACSSGRLTEQTGFAHGYAGISTALLMLSAETGNESYYAAGLDLMCRESAKFNPEHNGWDTTDGYRNGMNAWCYGAPGILLARELARPFLKNADRALAEHDIALALQCTEQAVISGEKRPLLCHGLAGNLTILQWYAKRTGNQSASQTAAQGVSRLLRLLLDDALPLREATNCLQISFMDGLCGLGYCLLQQLQPDIPSVLALEIQ